MGSTEALHVQKIDEIKTRLDEGRDVVLTDISLQTVRI